MPTISMFYGIIIRMYALDNKQHHLPHIHVEYAEAEAVFQIPDGELLEGMLPNKQYKLENNRGRTTIRKGPQI